MPNKINKKGFTLIELLLYIGIGSVLLVLIGSFFQISLAARVKNKTISEVEQQGVQIMQIISQTIINTQSITAPAVGNSSANTVLVLADPSKNPTAFDLSNGAIRIIEGVNPPLNLSSSIVNVDNLVFENLSSPDSPGILRVEFTISYMNNSGRNEYSWSKTFYNSISLR